MVDSGGTIGRRSFLSRTARVSGGLAAAVAAPSLLRSADRNETIRVAVAGIRGRGRNHVDGFSTEDRCEVAAICDPDTRLLDGVASSAAGRQGKAPAKMADLRRALDDRTIDALIIATPDHWHGPATIWACQAGKDVYVEKPAAHNFREARLMVEAARKYDRIVQHGTQSRSAVHIHKAVELLRSGDLGRIIQAKAINSQKRANIGKKKDAPVPPGVDYDLWLGPAPKRPFNPNRFHYNWHWFWDYGTGDMGNDGVHQIDIARWGLGDLPFPNAVSCGGGKYHFDDDQETPDTQTVVFEYDDTTLVYEMRLWTPYREHGVENGNVFYGEKGYMVFDNHGWRVFWKGSEAGPSGGHVNDRGADHRKNFLECMRTRKRPIADIEVGFHSSALCHLGNIAYRVGRRLRFDRKKLEIVGDREAHEMLGREYRKPYEIAEVI